MCGAKKIEVTILVLQERLLTLLGRNDAKALKLLCVAIYAFSELIKAVESVKPLEKLKNFQLRIPIDKIVSPLIQPIHRIPYALRSCTKEQIKVSLQADIIQKMTNVLT